VPLLLDAASYLALVVAGLLLRTRRRRAPAATTERATTWRLRDDRTLLVMVGALAAVVAGVSAINVVDVFFIRDTLAASTTTYGFVASAWTVGMLAGSGFFGRLRPGRITVPGMLALAAGTCLAVLASAAVTGAWWIVPFWILGGICNGGINVFTTVIIAGRVPADAHGRAFAVLGASVQGGSLFGLSIGGPLVEHFEPRVLVAAFGLAGLVAAVGCLPAVRMRPEPPPAAGPAENDPVRDSVGT
jgi:MFS family permease